MLAAANPDTEPDSPVEADSPLVAPRRIQTGQNSLSAVAKNFVPQTGHVRGSALLQTELENRGLRLS